MTNSADLKKPTDLDLHLFVKAGHILFRFSRSRVNILMGWQTVCTQIRLKEQSDLGVHCLHMPFC